MYGVLRALLITMETARRKPVTREYPRVHKKLPERSRGLPLLLWDFAVEEPFCVGCHQCERACPVECMTVTLKQNPKYESGESKRKTIVDEFYIDDARCMRCNICAEVCPTNFSAITLQGSSWVTNELSALDRKNLVLDLEQLLTPSKLGVLINTLTPEQNQLAPEGSRAWLWARGELPEAVQATRARRPGRLRTLAKAKLLKLVYQIRGH